MGVIGRLAILQVADSFHCGAWRLAKKAGGPAMSQDSQTPLKGRTPQSSMPATASRCDIADVAYTGRSLSAKTGGGGPQAGRDKFSSFRNVALDWCRIVRKRAW
jgi:hypothetical protein